MTCQKSKEKHCLTDASRCKRLLKKLKKVGSKMKNIITWWLCRKINSLLEQHKDNVVKVKSKLNIWIARLEKVLAAFKSILENLEDNAIDSEEIDQTVAEIEQVIKEW